jgi:hypothetical protein
MSSAKLKLGIYYFRKSVSRFSEDDWVLCHNLFLNQMLRILFLERKNQKEDFFFPKVCLTLILQRPWAVIGRELQNDKSKVIDH